MKIKRSDLNRLIEAFLIEKEEASFLENYPVFSPDLDDEDSGVNSDTGAPDTGEYLDPDEIEYHENLPFAQGRPMRRDKEKLLKQGREARYLYSCAAGECAQYVSDTLDRYQGNAWHAHKYTDPTLKSVFNNNAQKQWLRQALANVFRHLNKNSGGSTSDNKIVKRIVTKMIPDQSAWQNLQLGEIVGLYHPDSSLHYKAFFEAASGTAIGQEGDRETVSGTFFINKDTGEPWKTSDMGKDIIFLPGKTLNSGKSFGMNTHLGFVGAKYKGEPIIFHNVKGVVTATPLRAMGKKDFIVWSKKPSVEIS